MPEPSVQELRRSFRSLAIRLESLSTLELPCPWEPWGSPDDERRLMQRREACRAEALQVGRKIYLAAEPLELNLKPLLDVLHALEGEDSGVGDASMSAPPVGQLIAWIQARAGVERVRPSGGSPLLRAPDVVPSTLAPLPLLVPGGATARQLEARAMLAHVYARRYAALVIHYSCGLFGTEDQPAEVGHIVTKRLAYGEVSVFDARRDGEAAALAAFHSHVTLLPDALWVNWNMRDHQFGFEAIARRQRTHGLPETTVAPDRRLNLSRVLSDVYGSGYIGHPKLLNLVRLNEITDMGILDKAAAAAAYEAGQWEVLLASTLRKVQVIEALFNRAAEGTLQTLVKPTDLGVDGGRDSMDAPKEKPPRKKRPTTRRTAEPGRPPLVGPSKIIFDIIKSLPKGQGLSGKELLAKMRPEDRIVESTLTRHVVPILRQYGVQGSHTRGYHIPSNPRKASADRR